MTFTENVKLLQKFANVEQDGDFGPVTAAALVTKLSLVTDDVPPMPPRDTQEWHAVKATSFADTEDVRRFRECKSEGHTDEHCFGVGDNGVGFAAMPVENDNTWVPVEDDGDGRINCADPNVACCALPPEIWLTKFGSIKNAAGKKVVVRYNGKDADAILGDTMPHLRNITNGAGIDMNPALCSALGLTPPVEANVWWRWNDQS